ncbi:MAG: HIT domain-containing protein [Epsilonproteobacteria bacterium]|nr:HIT domain-containing protein [Campylobacterota bacterium]
MKKLYAPWRHDYINNVARKQDKDSSEKGCVFCKQLMHKDDDKYYIIKRFSDCAVMMNYYPYNAGHVMVLPYHHQPNLDNLTPLVRTQMMEVVSLSTTVIGKTLNSEGFNVGINLGSAGGGGLPSHLHIHVLPRWKGDTNFLETTGGVKIVSSDLDKMYFMLKEAFANTSID